MTFADKLIELRRLNTLSQEGLAEKLDVSRQAISRWETGAAMPDAQNLLQMSRIFGVTVDFLLNDESQSDIDIPIVSTTKRILQKEQKRNNLQHYTKAILVSTAIIILYACIIFTTRERLGDIQTFILPLLTPLPLLYLSIFRHESLTKKSVLIISIAMVAIVGIITISGFCFNLNYFDSPAQSLLVWAFIIENYTAAAFCSLCCFIPFLSIKRKWWVNTIIFIISALIAFSMYCVYWCLSEIAGTKIYWIPNIVPPMAMLVSQTAFIISWYFVYSEGKRKIEKM